MTKEFNVFGMMCEKCVERVKNAFEARNEVENVNVSLEENKVSLDLREELSDEVIKSIVEDLGYELK